MSGCGRASAEALARKLIIDKEKKAIGVAVPSVDGRTRRRDVAVIERFQRLQGFGYDAEALVYLYDRLCQAAQSSMPT